MFYNFLCSIAKLLMKKVNLVVAGVYLILVFSQIGVGIWGFVYFHAEQWESFIICEGIVLVLGVLLGLLWLITPSAKRNEVKLNNLISIIKVSI